MMILAEFQSSSRHADRAPGDAGKMNEEEIR